MDERDIHSHPSSFACLDLPHSSFSPLMLFPSPPSSAAQPPVSARASALRILQQLLGDACPLSIYSEKQVIL